MSNTDSNDEEIMVHMVTCTITLEIRKRKGKGDIGYIRILKKNIHCRLFVVTKELQQIDSKFIAFYRMSKDSYMHLVQLITPYIRQKNTNMR